MARGLGRRRSRALAPHGVVVEGCTLGDVDHATAEWMRALLAEHGVMVLADQEPDDDTFVRFLRRFGDLTFTVGERPVPGHRDLNVVSNVGRAEPPRSTFHADTTYVRQPPAYTALRAVRVPSRGGATLFTDQYRAFATLDPVLRDRLDGRSIRHVVTDLELGEADEQEAEHSIFRPHPVTGRIALYLSTPARCASVSGLGEAESRSVIDRLFEHSTRPDNLLRHEWAPGDVVMWDNACVMHRADHAGVEGDRVMHRGMVAAAPADRPPR